MRSTVCVMHGSREDDLLHTKNAFWPAGRALPRARRSPELIAGARTWVSSCHQHTHAKPPRFMQQVLSYSSRLHCLLLRARTLRTPHAQCNKTPQIGPLSRRAASSLVHSRSSISCTDIPITTRAHMRAYTYDAYLVRPWRLEVYSIYTTVYFVFSNSFFFVNSQQFCYHLLVIFEQVSDSTLSKKGIR
jgi:hypothetical protein